MNNSAGLLFLLLFAAGCEQATQTTPTPLADRFVVIDSGGLANQQDTGDCVEDTQTGLMWEIKSDTAGLHNWRNTYSWFNPNENVDELDYRGTADGGSCENSDCDTWSYTQVVNGTGLCGHFDWRLPSRNELMSISELSKADNPPTIDLRFFPRTQVAEYWTGFDYATQYQSAWAWNFRYGHDRVDWKKSPKYVRLVRGNATNLDSVKE